MCMYFRSKVLAGETFRKNFHENWCSGLVEMVLGMFHYALGLDRNRKERIYCTRIGFPPEIVVIFITLKKKNVIFRSIAL